MVGRPEHLFGTLRGEKESSKSWTDAYTAGPA
jgi:hypothetical protein